MRTHTGAIATATSVALIAAVTASHAQIIENLAEPTIRYEAEILPDGTVQVSPVDLLETSGENGSSDPSPTDKPAWDGKDWNPGENDVDPRVKWESQEWYARMSATGDVVGWYAVPEGEAIPAGLLAPGESVMRVSAPGWVTRIAPTGAEIRAIVELLRKNVIDAVCDMEGRPARFGSEVDVSAGLGITGRVAFNVEWETAELCK